MTPWVKRGKVYLSTGQNRVWRVMKQRDWPFYGISWRWNDEDHDNSIWTSITPRQATVREAKAYAVWADNHEGAAVGE